MAARKPKKRLTNASPMPIQADSIADTTKDFIREHARAAMPNECCGFIATQGGKQKAFRSRNDSLDPRHYFRTNAEDWQKVEDDGWEIVAIYHSHVYEPPIPSAGDKTESERQHVPFVIVGWPTDTWGVYTPTGWRAELVGRPFVHGVLDCAEIVKDYYAEKLGIEIPHFDRPDEWWLHGQDLYVENYKTAGFTEVDDLQTHDVLLIQMPHSPVINHCAVYLGDGHMLHHVADRLSKIEPYVSNAGYSRRVRMIVRHGSLL